MSKKEESNMMKTSIKKINKLFNEMKKSGFAVDEKKVKRGVSDSNNTYETYKNLMVSLARDYNQKFGVADIRKFKKENIKIMLEERLEQYYDGKISEATNLKSILSALDSFQKFSAEENSVFKKTIDFVDVEKEREYLNKKQVLRKADHTTNKLSDYQEGLVVIENMTNFKPKSNRGFNENMRKQAINIAKTSISTGGRVNAIFDLTVDQIDLKNNKITYFEDKGGKTRVVAFDKEAAVFLKGLVDEANEKNRKNIFEFQRMDGTIMKKASAESWINQFIRKNAEEFTVTKEVIIKDRDMKDKKVEITQTFTMHSFRKSFAENRTNYYYKEIAEKGNFEKYLAARSKDDEKIIEKYNVALARINADRNTDRKMNKREQALFLTSVDLGHYRLDVMKYYVDKNQFPK